MKPFLGINITENKKNEQHDCGDFAAKKPSAELSVAYDKAFDAAMTDVIKKAQFPIAVRVVQWICGAAAAVILLGILKSIMTEDNITLPQAYSNAPWMFWVGGICLAAWVVLVVIAKKVSRDVLDSDKSADTIDKLNTAAQSIMDELNIPSDAAEVDILYFTYKIKDGEPVAKEQCAVFTPYTNANMYCFTEGDLLIISELEYKYAFPLSELKKIHTVKKKIILPFWNKDEEPTSGKYKQYKMSVDQYDNVHIKSYHILEVERDGESWGIYFPCYELETIESLTGLKAE